MIKKFNREQVKESIDCALKNKPSFGGFLLVFKEKGGIVGAIVVNKSGMSNNGPEDRISLIALAQNYSKKEYLAKLMIHKALGFTNGSVGFFVRPDHPHLKYFSDVGFEASYLELRLGQPIRRKPEVTQKPSSSVRISG